MTTHHVCKMPSNSSNLPHFWQKFVNHILHISWIDFKCVKFISFLALSITFYQVGPNCCKFVTNLQRRFFLMMLTTQVDHRHIDHHYVVDHPRRPPPRRQRAPPAWWSAPPPAPYVVRNASSAPHTPIYPPCLLRDAEHIFDPCCPLFGAHHNPGSLPLLCNAAGTLPPLLNLPSLSSLCRIY